MNIKYLFGDSMNYMNYNIDVAAKTVTGTYVRNGNVIVEETMDITPVLSVSSTKLPTVELAKRGYIWDFRLSKRDDNDALTRKTLSILTEFSLVPTNVEFSNPTGVNRMLKDLTSYPLSAYESPMTVKHKVFSNADHVVGISHTTALSPIIGSGGLLIGPDALLNVMMAGENIPAATVPTYISFKFAHLPTMITNSRVIEFHVGTNIITINGNRLEVNGAYVCDIHTLTTSDRLIFFKGQCIFKGVSYPCIWNPSDFSEVKIVADSNIEDFVLEDILIQGVDNFYEDSNPPASITNLMAQSGDKEVFLWWDKNKDADLLGYNVYVNGIKHNLVIAHTEDYQVTGLTNGIEYLVTVTAVDKSGNESIPVESLKVTTVSEPAKEVSDVKIDSTSAGIQFNFTPPTYADVDRIRIYQQDLSNVGLNLIAELPYNQTSYLHTDKPVMGKYMYVISTVNIAGEETTGVQTYHYFDYAI